MTPTGTLDFEIFGNSVSVAGDVLVGGAIGTSSQAGSATVYRWNGTAWIQEQTLTAFAASPGDDFWMGVATNGHVIVSGSMLDDVGS